MPRGAAVIRYEGPRGVSWRIKYADAGGRQVMETLGREPDWDERRAERALGARLEAVEKGMRKPRVGSSTTSPTSSRRSRCRRVHARSRR